MTSHARVCVCCRACRGKHLVLLVRFPNQGRQLEEIDVWTHQNETLGGLRRQVLHRCVRQALALMLVHTMLHDQCWGTCTLQLRLIDCASSC